MSERPDTPIESAIRDLAVAIELLASASVHEIGTNLVGEIHGLTTHAMRTIRDGTDD